VLVFFYEGGDLLILAWGNISTFNFSSLYYRNPKLGHTSLLSVIAIC